MNKYDLIINNVAKLHKTYDSYDPLTICNQLGIKVHFFDLKQKLKGFFFYQSRQKNIVIDSNVNEIFKRILVAHELGHALLHNKAALSYGFYDSEVFEQRSFVENEANFFASELILKDDDVLYYLQDYSFFDAARQLYVPAALLDYKINLLKAKGYTINSMYVRKAEFLKNDVGAYDDLSTYIYD